MAKLKMLGSRIPTMDTRAVKPPPKTADPELLTHAHRVWAADVINRANGECQDPQHAGDRRGHRLVADHIKERRDRPDLALDPRNGRASCWSCHTRKTNEERAKRMKETGGGGGAMHPAWLRPSKVPLTIVCGPPASGKSTYVNQRSHKDDLVVDLDEIGSRISGLPIYTWGREWLGAALRERNSLLGRLSSSRVQWPRAWFIASEPKAERREWWMRVLRPQSIVVCLASETICHHRIASDVRRAGRREELSSAVVAWWNDYTPRIGDVVVQ